VLEADEPTGALLSTKQAARRQRIVDAAMAMLEEREFERIQVKDIADGASVALGTVYHYFSSKEHLFGEVLVQWAGSLRTSITRRSLAGADPAARLEDALHRSVRAFERRPPLARLVARLQVSEDPFAVDVLDRLDAVTRRPRAHRGGARGARGGRCARQLAPFLVGGSASHRRCLPVAQ
jgi:AcrR family transcriptional regulator